MISTSPGGSAESQPLVLAPEDWASLPSEVYVPIESTDVQDGQVQLELREIGAAGQALPVYRSLAALASACGSEQPWMSIYSSRIPHLAELTGFRTVFADVAMPEPAADETVGPVGDQQMLYAPSRTYEPGDETAWLELQPIPGDQLALVVFSSLELLHAGCGPHQTWVSFRADALTDIQRSTGANVVFKDRALPEQVRWGSPSEVSSFGLTETGQPGSGDGGRRETGIQHTRSVANGDGA